MINPKLNLTKETLINSTNEMRHEAHGTQQSRHINKIGEDARTAQRSDSLVQLINQRFPKSTSQIGIALVGISAGLCLMLLTGCSGKAPMDAPPPVPQVEVVTVVAQTIEDEPEFIGQTEAFRPVEIRSQVSGIIKKVFFTKGRNIKKDDQVYLIDPVQFNAI